jgi:hypothetical protein
MQGGANKLGINLAFHLDCLGLHIYNNRTCCFTKQHPYTYVNCVKKSHEFCGANGVLEPEFVCEGL